MKGEYKVRSVNVLEYAVRTGRALYAPASTKQRRQ